MFVAHVGSIEILTQTAGELSSPMSTTVPIDNNNLKHTYIDMNKHCIDMMGSIATGPQYFALQTDATTACKDTLTPGIVRDPNNQLKRPQTNMGSVVQGINFFKTITCKSEEYLHFQRRAGLNHWCTRGQTAFRPSQILSYCRRVRLPYNLWWKIVRLLFV